MTVEKTAGELAFEKYLESHSLSWEHEKAFPGRPKKPDYAVPFHGDELLFEVKDFDTPLPLPPAGFQRDPYSGIREKVNQATQKFRRFKDHTCSLVMYVASGLVSIGDPRDVFGAMYGDIGIQVLFDKRRGSLVPDSAGLAFGEGGKMTRPADTAKGREAMPQNTTISALVALRHLPIGRLRFVYQYLASFPPGEYVEHLGDDPGFDKHETALGVIVYENKDARRPLPEDLFRGHFDERWGVRDGAVQRLFAGEGALAIRAVR